MVRLRASLLALGLIAIVGCGSEDHVVQHPQARVEELPSQEVKDFSLEESDTGTPEWILTSRYAATYDRRGVIVARDVAIDFFDSKGAKYSHLTAKEGEIKRPSNDMEARGDVRVTTTYGVRIQTDSLRFHKPDRKNVSAEGNFTRHGQFGSNRGVGKSRDQSRHHRHAGRWPVFGN